MRRDLSHFRHILLAPVTGTMGAKIQDIDVGAEVAAPVIDELRQALSEFNVLVFRDQRLDGPALARFARNFGEVGMSPMSGGKPSKQAFSRLTRSADMPADARNFGDRWHMDRAGDEVPPKGLLLYCEEAPPYGGDTLFASLSAAYDALPPELQRRCAGLTGIHSMSGLFDFDSKEGEHRWTPGGGKRALLWNDQAKLDHIRREAEHPLVCRHPDTGRPFLFVTGAYLLRIKELGAEDGAALIDQLNRHVVQPEFTCRLRWRKGSLAILDNRCTQHYAVNDCAGFARTMLRVELQGDWRPQRYGTTDAVRAA
jgi:taurine dioxygenase